MNSPRNLAAGILAGMFIAAPTGAAPAPAPPASAAALDRAFLAENRPAMDRMMAGMTITSAHDVDRDFAAMMIPHHQGAIDMAVLELKYGRNEQLRRIAQEIIVEQQQEIIAMRLALGEPPPPSAPTPDQPPQRQ
ncbi:MAG TPA: DUF305 domain-containing protein [Caulobacteraceae bacterium]|jgi:hypothetical protein